MTKLTQRLLLLYMSLIVCFAALGATNQSLYRQQWGLVEEKESLQRQLSDLRAAAAEVKGPSAVRAWALEQGMVPAPQVSNIAHVLPSDTPALKPVPEGLEVYTQWR